MRPQPVNQRWLRILDEGIAREMFRYLTTLSLTHASCRPLPITFDHYDAPKLTLTMQHSTSTSGPHSSPASNADLPRVEP
jgi:hypothetical protein